MPIDLKEIAFIGGGSVVAEIIAHPFSTGYVVWLSGISLKQSVAQIRKTGGIYAGFSAQLVTSFPGVFFYLEGRKLPLQFSDGKSYLAQCMQGLCGVAAGTIVWGPASRLATLQQASGNAENAFNRLSILGKSKFIWKNEGARGLYQGAVPGACFLVVNDIIGYWLQALLLQRYSEEKRNDYIPSWLTAMIAFSFAAIITSPINVCVTRLRASESINPTDKKMSQVFQTVYKNSGFRGFFRALPLAMGYSAAWYATMSVITTYRKKNAISMM